jgi:iron complex transport system ATP-binding protein
MIASLDERSGRIVVVVLHDLDLACRYARHIVAMRGGQVVARGTSAEVVDAPTVAAVLGLDCVVIVRGRRRPRTRRCAPPP